MLSQLIDRNVAEVVDQLIGVTQVAIAPSIRGRHSSATEGTGVGNRDRVDDDPYTEDTGLEHAARTEGCRLEQVMRHVSALSPYLQADYASWREEEAGRRILGRGLTLKEEASTPELTWVDPRGGCHQPTPSHTTASERASLTRVEDAAVAASRAALLRAFSSESATGSASATEFFHVLAHHSPACHPQVVTRLPQAPDRNESDVAAMQQFVSILRSGTLFPGALAEDVKAIQQSTTNCTVLAACAARLLAPSRGLTPQHTLAVMWATMDAFAAIPYGSATSSGQHRDADDDESASSSSSAALEALRDVIMSVTAAFSAASAQQLPTLNKAATEVAMQHKAVLAVTPTQSQNDEGTAAAAGTPPPSTPWRVAVYFPTEARQVRWSLAASKGLPHELHPEVSLVLAGGIAEQQLRQNQSMSVSRSASVTSSVGSGSLLASPPSTSRWVLSVTAAASTVVEVPHVASRSVLLVSSFGPVALDVSYTIGPPSIPEEPAAGEWGAWIRGAAALLLRDVVVRVLRSSLTGNGKGSGIGGSGGEDSVSSATPLLPLFAGFRRHHSGGSSSATATGSGQEERTQLETIIRNLRAGSDWQPVVLEALFRALVNRCGSVSDVATYLTRRWRIDWVSILQGAVHDDVRARLLHLCSFVAQCEFDTASAGASPKAVADHIKAMLIRGDSVEGLLQRVGRRQSVVAAIAAWLRDCAAFAERDGDDARLSLPFEAAVCVLLSEVAAGGLLERLDGGRAEDMDTITSLVHRALASRRDGGRAQPMAGSLKAAVAQRHQFDSITLRSLLSSITADTEGGTQRKGPPRGDALLHVPRFAADLADNFMASDLPGVRISRAAAGDVEIDRTQMGFFCARAVRAWGPFASPNGSPNDETAEGPSIRYFEARLGGDGAKAQTLKRAWIGVCGAQDNVNSHALLREDVRRRCYFVDSDGRSHGVPFGSGDVVGCGVVAVPQSRVLLWFTTLNGLLLTQEVGGAPPAGKEGEWWAVPFATTDTTDRFTMSFNFGTSPFLWHGDGLSLASLAAWQSAPLLSLSPNVCMAIDGSGWFLCTLLQQSASAVSNDTVDDTAALVDVLLQLLSRRVSSLRVSQEDDGAEWGPRQVLKELLRVWGVIAASTTTTLRADQVQTLIGALLDTIAAAQCASATLSFEACRIVEDALRVVTLLLLRGCPLPSELQERVLRVVEGVHVNAVAQQRMLLEAPATAIPYYNWWSACTEAASLNGCAVQLSEKQLLGHAVGVPLPNRGQFQFSVSIQSGGSEQMAVQNFGQYFIGVTTLEASELASGTWRERSPPAVWAVHSIPDVQLPHCQDASFSTDGYTFSANSVVTIQVNRDEGTLSMTRTGRTFHNLFSGIPKSAVLRPFVQLVDAKTAARLIPGQCQQACSHFDTLIAQLAATERAMLLRADFADRLAARIVGALTQHGKDGGAVARSLPPSLASDSVTAAVLRAAPLPTAVSVLRSDGTLERGAVCVALSQSKRHAVVAYPSGSMSRVAVDALLCGSGEDVWEPWGLATAANHVAVLNGMDAPLMMLTDDDDVDVARRPLFTTSGSAAVLDGLAQALVRWRHSVLDASILVDEELTERHVIEDAWRAEWESQVETHASEGSWKTVQQWNGGLMTGLLQGAPFPKTFTFNADASSEELTLPRHYNGCLALSPHHLTDTMRFFAVASEAIASTGITHLRFRVEFDWQGLLPDRTMPMSEGLYVGLCRQQVTSRVSVDHARQAATGEPMIWGVPSHDTKPFHLPHSCRPCTGAVQVFSRDIIRLVVNRDAGTIEAFRTPSKRTEVSLGVIFDRLPRDELLFPFAIITSPRTAVMLLPENAQLPRSTDNQLRYAPSLKARGHFCSGCLMQRVHATVEAPQWFRCNQCPNYSLCNNCFAQHIHSGHTFTHMRHVGFVPSTLTASDASRRAYITGTRGADVEIGALPIVPTLLVNGHLDADSFHTKLTPVVAHDVQGAEAAGSRGTLCVWGVLRRHGTPFELFASLSTAAATEGSANVDCVIGIAPSKFFTSDSPLNTVATILEKLKAPRTTPEPPFVAIATNADRLLGPHHAAHGSLVLSRTAFAAWTAGDDIAIRCSKEQEVSMSVNGSLYRHFSATKLWPVSEPLGVFVILVPGVAAGQQRTISPRTGAAVTLRANGGVSLLGKVGESNAKLGLVRVTNGTQNRWALTPDLHVPLMAVPNMSVLRPGMRVFAAVRPDYRGSATGHKVQDKVLVECAIERCEETDALVRVNDGRTCFEVACDSMFVAADVLQAATASKADPDAGHLYPDVKRRLRRFYEQYAPTKTDAEMDKAIDLYAKSKKGIEGLWEDLVKKYGPEPQPPRNIPWRPSAEHDLGVSSSECVHALLLLKAFYVALQSSDRLRGDGDTEVQKVPFVAMGGSFMSSMDALLSRLAPHRSSANAAATHTTLSIQDEVLATALRSAMQRDCGKSPFINGSNVSFGRVDREAPSIDRQPVSLNSPSVDTSSDPDVQPSPSGAGHSQVVCWGGTLATSLGATAKIVVDAVSMTAIITFTSLDTLTLMDVTVRVTRLDWNALEQRLRLFLELPSAAAGDDVIHRSLASLLGVSMPADEVLTSAHPLASLPVLLSGDESLGLVGLWDAAESRAIGEWRAVGGCQGTAVLTPYASDRITVIAPPLVVSLPCVRRHGDSPSTITAGRGATSDEASIGMEELFRAVASAIRLTPQFLARPLTTPYDATALLQELAVVLRRQGTTAFMSRLACVPRDEEKTSSYLTAAAVAMLPSTTQTTDAVEAAMWTLHTMMDDETERHSTANDTSFEAVAVSAVSAAHSHWWHEPVIEALAALVATTATSRQRRRTWARLLAPLAAVARDLAMTQRPGTSSLALLSALCDAATPVALELSEAGLSSHTAALHLQGRAMLLDAAAAIQSGQPLPAAADGNDGPTMTAGRCSPTPPPVGSDCSSTSTSSSSPSEGDAVWVAVDDVTEYRNSALLRGAIASRAPLFAMDAVPCYLELSTSKDTYAQIGVCTAESLPSANTSKSDDGNGSPPRGRRNTPPSPSPAEQPTEGGSGKKRRMGLLGFDATSVAFDGTCTFHHGTAQRAGPYLIRGTETLGMLVNLTHVFFFVNGQPAGPVNGVPLPSSLAGKPLHAICRAHVTTTNATRSTIVRSDATRLLFPVKGARSISAIGSSGGATPSTALRIAAAYDAQKRSHMHPLTVEQWSSLIGGTGGQPMDVAAAAAVQLRHLRVIMEAVLPTVDFDQQRSSLLRAVPVLKALMAEPLRRRMTHIPPLQTLSVDEKRTLPHVTVRWYQLFSTQQRSPAEALAHTVLVQLYRQLSGHDVRVVRRYLSRDPLFVTSLMMTESGHTPIDAGGPYSQTWTLLAEELATEESPPTAGTTEEASTAPTVAVAARVFNRNPLFCFVTSTKGRVLVPNRAFSAPEHLSIFRFFGAIMGYLIRSRRCLALELSPLIFKHLTGEPLTVEDFLTGYDCSLRSWLEDESLLASSDAENVFPKIRATYEASNGAMTWREAAEMCLVRSLDPQLNALAEGLAVTLPRSTTRFMTAAELALKLCGEPFPSFEQLQESITCSLPGPFGDMFWSAMKQLSPSEWSQFFNFASAQRRYPLSRKISVTATQQSQAHIPQASTCFSHVSTPLYRSVEVWVEKLRQAIKCQEMELA